jgi:hypothetical protein
MRAEASAPATELAGPGLLEAQRLPWRERASERTLRRDGRRWTLWTAGVLVSFGGPAILLMALNPWLFPAALILVVHAWLICRMQAGRAVRSVVPLQTSGAVGSPADSRHTPAAADDGPEGVALGLLGDLLGHRERELMQRSGLAMQRGRLGVWLLGERGALLVRPQGRRVFSFCVRVGEADDLPAGDRVAHLLLALREDEEGFATVANRNFSGATWRLLAQLPKRVRPALRMAASA